MKKEVKSNMDFISSNNDITTEFFRNIRNNIELNRTTKRPKTILITSVNEGEGKSYTVANLAISYANAGKKVLIIDADMKTGIQHKVFNVKNKNGLSEYLSKKDKYELKDYISSTNKGNIDIITKGDYISNSNDLLLEEKLKELIQLVNNIYDVTIFDGTASLISTDSVIISSYVDSTAIVVKYGQTKREDLETVKKNILNVGGQISGVIINRFPKYSKQYKDMKAYKESEKGRLVKTNENK